MTEFYQTQVDDWTHSAQDPDSYTYQEQKRWCDTILPLIFEHEDETGAIFAAHGYRVDCVSFDTATADERHHYHGRAGLYTNDPDIGMERLKRALESFAPCFEKKIECCIRRDVIREHVTGAYGVPQVVEHFAPTQWRVQLDVYIDKRKYHGRLGA